LCHCLQQFNASALAGWVQVSKKLRQVGWYRHALLGAHGGRRQVDDHRMLGRLLIVVVAGHNVRGVKIFEVKKTRCKT